MAEPTPLHDAEKMQDISAKIENLRLGKSGGSFGGNGGDGMDTSERMASIERAQIQTGMDLAYIKGRVEDMPTKDWFNARLLGVFGGLAVFITVALGILGAILA